MPEVNTKTISIERLKRFLDDLPATSPLTKQSVVGEAWHAPISIGSVSATITSKIVQFGSYLYTIIDGDLWWAPAASGMSWTRKDGSATYNNLSVVTYNNTSALILCTTSGIKYILGTSISNSNITTGNFIMEPVVIQTGTGTRIIIGSATSKTSATNIVVYADDSVSTWTTATSTCSTYFDGNGISYTYNGTQYILLGGTRTSGFNTFNCFCASNDNGVTWYQSKIQMVSMSKFITHTINNELRVYGTCNISSSGLYYFVPSMLYFDSTSVGISEVHEPTGPVSNGNLNPPIAVEHEGNTRLIITGPRNNTSNFSGGIFYSDDGGDSFTLVSGTDNKRWCVPIQVTVNNVKRLITITAPYSGTDGDILYSDDDGTTWNKAFGSDKSVIWNTNDTYVTPFMYLSSIGKLLVSTQKGILYSDNNETVPDTSDKSDDGKFVTRDFLKDTISDLLTYLDIRLS